MLQIGLIGFAAPMALLGLLALPLVWRLLRTVPPPAARRPFPPVALLAGLPDTERLPDTSPFWLRLIRICAVGLAILGLAGPVFNAESQADQASVVPALVLVDGGWASSADWEQRLNKAEEILEELEQRGRIAAFAHIAGQKVFGAEFRSADDWQGELSGLSPRPWDPDFDRVSEWVETELPDELDSFWISDGLHDDDKSELARMLAERGSVTVYESGGGVMALRRPKRGPVAATVRVSRSSIEGNAVALVDAIGSDASGIERRLDTATAEFADEEAEAVAEFSLPTEVLNRISRFELRDARSAGAVILTADSVSRRKVALLERDDADGATPLLSPYHYLRQALETKVELISIPSGANLSTNPDVVILADTPVLSRQEAESLLNWLDDGGLLVRFAGPRLAAETAARDVDDPLLPVQIRAGSMAVGGTLSWELPKRVAPFEEGSPFYGLEVPGDVEIRSQVLAQPGPELSDRVIAELDDGTPLATAKRVGQGRIVLFHISADAEWSNLPLSGLFVDILERLAITSKSDQYALPVNAEKLSWTLEQLVTAFGEVRTADPGTTIPGERMARLTSAQDMPPGLYSSGRVSAGVHAIDENRELKPAEWPETISRMDFATLGAVPAAGLLLGLAVLMFAADIVATLWLAGAAFGVRAAGILAMTSVFVFGTERSSAEDAFAIAATRETTVAYVLTGDSETDRMSAAGLAGLAAVLRVRTAVEIADPAPIDIEHDELAFFPLIYWPVAPSHAELPVETFERVNEYMRSGGMILFDTKDSDVGGFQIGTDNSDALRRMGEHLEIPTLERLRQGHVLSRSYYLLAEFPGRHSGAVWVEASVGTEDPRAPWASGTENDGVTPIVVGGNDWAAAWAVGEDAVPLLLVGQGETGESRREKAHRFGVNLVMHALTGNYKSAPFHIDAILGRLGS